MGDELKTLLESARNHKMTALERFDQRVSFVFSGVTDSSITKEDVRAQLAEEYGDPALLATAEARLKIAREALFKARHRLLKEGFKPEDPTVTAVNNAIKEIDDA